MTLSPFLLLRSCSSLRFCWRRCFRVVVGLIVVCVLGLMYLTINALRDNFHIKTLKVHKGCKHEANCGTKSTGFYNATRTNTFTSKGSIENQHLAVKAGYLNVHTWFGICGTAVDNLRLWPHFPYLPDKRSYIWGFQRTQDHATNSDGERIFGFVHPQRDGIYQFAITSDDASELWLSCNESVAFSERIARVYSPGESAWTEEGDYQKYPEQISKKITLQANKRYYIETLSKQGSGAAHVAVYWSFNSSKFEIISSRFLSNYSGSKNHESIPPHVGKQGVISIQGIQDWIQEKGNLFHFNRLPLLDRKLYTSYIPTCPYSPSFLVRRKLQPQEAAWKWMANESYVYPKDDTDMITSIFQSYWSKPNPLIDESRVESVVNKFMTIGSLHSRDYFLKKIHKVIQKPDPKNGDRFLLNLELGLNDTNQTFRLSEHVYQPKGKDNLCLPHGMNWNSSAKVYFILPVKDQGNWVQHFINQLTDASLLTNDTNFHVMVIDFESKDIDMAKAFNTSLLSSRHNIISLTGKFYKTLALNKAVQLVPHAHDIIFLIDLHVDVPADIMDSVRMNTIAGRMTYFPIVGRLECDSSSIEHRGFWQMNGYGIMAIYKSDWDKFGGMNIRDYKYRWGGEDWDLLNRVMMLPVEVERIKHPGLYHHYHAKQRQWN